jgi:uncharacterized membrane protein YoaT (DUF817 family)
MTKAELGRRPNAARNWPFLVGFVAAERRVGMQAQASGRVTAFAYEFLRFGMKQGWACLFAGMICALLIGTYLAYPADAALSRYDFLTLAAMAIQVLLLVLGMEAWEEAKVIAL